jgi:hypothetical protein
MLLSENVGWDSKEFEADVRFVRPRPSVGQCQDHAVIWVRRRGAEGKLAAPEFGIRLEPSVERSAGA